jgi:hypothetical protein
MSTGESSCQQENVSCRQGCVLYRSGFTLCTGWGLVDRNFGLVDLVNKALGLVNKPKRHFEMACMLLMINTKLLLSRCSKQPWLACMRSTTFTPGKTVR